MAVISENIGATIALLRKRKGLTQRALADMLGVTDKAVSRWERGIGMPDQSLLAGLAGALDVDIESILAGEHAQVGDKWMGLVLLDYAQGFGPASLLFDRPALALQLGYLMLAGLDEVMLAGSRRDLDDACRVVEGLSGLGVSFYGVELRGQDTSGVRNALEKGFPEVSNCADELGGLLRGCDGVLAIDGLDFVYGKDLTRTFKRQIAEVAVSTRLHAYGGVPLHFLFVPNRAGFDGGPNAAGLVRGVVAFPIDSPQDGLDAAGLISTISRHQPDPFMDLGAIARARSFVGGR